MTDFIGVINLFSGISQILLGGVVYFSDLKDKVKRYYFLSTLFLGLWSLSIYFYSNPQIFDSTTWLRIVYSMAYCMTLGLILFARVYPVELKEKFRLFLIIISIYMVGMGFVLWTTNYIVVDTVQVADKYNSIAKMGPLYLLYGLPEFITAAYVVAYYLKQSKVLEGIKKRQVQFYVMGGIIMLVPVFLFDFIFPLLLNDTSYYKYSTLGNTAWTVIVGYSILTTRFLDVRIIVGSIASVFLKSLILILLLLGILFGIVPLWEITLSIIGVFKLTIVAIFAVLIITKLFNVVEEFVANNFIYVKYHPIKTLREYSNKNLNTVNWDDIVNSLLEVITNSFKTYFVYTILFNDKNQLVINKASGNSNIDTSKIIEILDVWKRLNSNRILIFSELKNDRKAGKKIIDDKRNSILSFMEENKIEIIFSLKEFGKFEGAVFVGQKSDHNSFTVGDIDFLDSIMQSTQIALIRASLYSELKTFNITLQEKVNEQTQELQVKVKELEEARRKENDMIDIMGHELRTPATIVKLNASFLTKFIGEITSNPEGYQKYVKRIQDAIENEIKLINTLLSSAKLEGDKIELNPKEVDIKQEIEMAMHGCESEAKNKGLVLINNTNMNTPSVYADKARVVEILNNLLSNSIKYTNKGGVEIYTEYDKNFVKISIKDTGKGIAKEDIPKLGQKFYRASTYINSDLTHRADIVRPGGTGLGLFVTYNLVKKMGGDITVNSEIGKGTTFSFTLPRFNGQEISPSLTSNNMFEKIGLRR
ncbi:hypothetical protein A3K02_00230 [candidate division WS6 bacterium RIFOXYD1_FULL_33_8]|uniref:histidine kinase n=2 Tax=Candidatus Dojkabacteria TaxID=74243 RepID=A0A0G0DJF5_9BACT|nr:MAG: external sensor signal transduction histidine kinase [candidate division WS6 bacterium GW2011_GWE2_33_157]KKP44664.1 MAG: external sensor signal transduction histidine kinase [candidate division WS6 bacterium GW2011_GWC1_33_20]KKP45996.1 MAG: external sensor signal transduction histidine kinase [candidate division WS6 bacterium GW2011_GWF1_33_233]KKP55492.1 MAG: Signal transduction histidine kinase [candidate division WS6 bacterium GW2011_GWB1_33_6]KKP55573.1 MAG: external sensor signal